MFSSKERAEAILPTPTRKGLETVEFNPEYPFPVIQTCWADGSMIVSVAHQSEVHVKDPSSDCRGLITVPIPKGATGDRQRFCNGCGQEVTIVAVGAVKVDAIIGLRQEREKVKKARKSGITCNDK